MMMMMMVMVVVMMKMVVVSMMVMMMMMMMVVVIMVMVVRCPSHLPLSSTSLFPHTTDGICLYMELCMCVCVCILCPLSHAGKPTTPTRSWKLRVTQASW